MSVEVIRPSQVSEADRAAWSTLQQASKELDSPFLSPDWALAVEAAEGPDSTARVAIFRDGDRARAFLPVSTPFQTARPLGGAMCDYQGYLAEPGFTVDPMALIEGLGVARFDFANVLRSQTALAPYFKGVLPAYSADLSQGYERYALWMGESQGILGELQSLRTEIEATTGPLRYRAMSRCRQDLEQMLNWREEPMEPWAERLIDSLFSRREQGFGGGLFTLHCGDRLIAAQFYLRGKRTLHAWLSSHERAMDRFWPGLLLSAGIMRWMDDKPYDTVDFGVGGAFSGRHLCNVVRNVGIGTVAHPHPSSLLRSAAERMRLAAGKAHIGEIAALPARALRAVGGLR
ncbi:MAG TPA: GNAT family N-acetyltransferase [Caulobacteraceae bacterium]|nr:GNAT family N-acetyltransferase [Caulobacteraceae bacterium]